MVFASLEAQIFKNFEVIICDDGSKPEVVERIRAYMKSSPLAIQHLWHEDLGFRKNRMLNQGIRNAKSDYLIFVDADCVLHPKFIFDHVEHKVAGVVLAGRRVDLTPSITRALSRDRVRSGFLQRNFWWIFFAILWMKDNNAPKGIYFNSPFWLRLANRKARGIVGCNFSVHKQVLLAINGFDMRYEGPGIGEDSDIEFRLRLNGVVIKPFTHKAIQYHLYHRLLKRASVNDEIFDQVRASGKSATPFGVAQLMDAEVVPLL